VLTASALEEELRAEQRARSLLQAVSVASARSVDLDETVVAVLREVCRATGWPLGHAMRRAPDGALESAHLWHLSEPSRFEPFREASEATRFGPWIGLPGRVLASGKAHWVVDVLADGNFPRGDVAREVGIHAAFAFPVWAAGEVVLVLEFASAEPASPDLPLLDVMETLGLQLGWKIEGSRAVEALRASEGRLRSLTETANDAIVTADAEGNVVSWNGCAARMFGYQREEILGRPLTALIPERFRAAHESGLARVRGGGERRVIGKTVELAGLRADSTEFPVELSLAAWKEGDKDFYTGIIRDITARKEVEAQLTGATMRLEHSEREAVEASKAKSLFLANMSHELRTPLNAILGFVQILERDRDLSSDQRQHLGIISRSGEHLLGLINDVLSIAKIEAGETELHPVDFELTRLLGSLREMFHLRAQARGLGMVLDHDIGPSAFGASAMVRGDEGKLRQVLINLIGNAVKFTEVGGVALRARLADGRVTFEVEDTGCGISDEELPRVFEPFAQASGGRRSAEGTGLGLSISRDFVRMLGGELTVRTGLGRGTRFAFTIPLPPGEERAPLVERSSVIGLEPGQVHPRILVVDNSDDNRTLLCHLLRAVGLPVREAVNGREAVEIWRSWRPTFVWMDLRMPVMDGYEATRAIRAAEVVGLGRTVIVALTASAFEHDRTSILAAGCDEIVSKPFREDTVFATMSRHLGVRYTFAEQAPASRVSDVVSLSTEQLGELPADVRAELERCLVEGDDIGAQQVIDRVDATHRVLATVLRKLVVGFRFDELLGVLERLR